MTMIGTSEFNNIKLELSGHDPLIKRTQLRDIQLDDKSIENGYICIHGHHVPVSRSFFNRLGQIVNLNSSLMNRMAKHEDKIIQTKLLETVKAYAETRDGGKDFLLIGDQNKHVITNIVVADRYSRLTNNTLFATAETLLNEVPGLSVDSIDNTGNGNMRINLVHAKDNGFERLGPDEVFRFGVSLVNSNNASRIDEFMYRLICDNGMIIKTQTGSESDIDKGSGGTSRPGAFRDILNQAHIWARDGFVPVSFHDKLTKAMNTEASLAEMSRAFDLVESQLTEEDSDRKIWLVKAVKAKLFPHLEETERRIITKGFNSRELNLEQKKFIKTGHTIWDLVNDLTWLGSHKSTFPMTNHKKFKVEGGNLFVKNWDLEHAALTSL